LPQRNVTRLCSFQLNDCFQSLCHHHCPPAPA
jgi:hypothetical protein